MISVTLPGSSIDALWQSFANDLLALDVTRYLGVAFKGAEVTSVRRRILADALLHKNIRLSAVTEDKVTNGFATAMSWLGVDVGAFTLSELDRAIAHLDVPDDRIQRVKAELERLSRAY
ncbi:hypothetical protein [Chondromyces crocatus]|nr:hypothetical protein [Chondromyces crocatus]